MYPVLHSPKNNSHGNEVAVAVAQIVLSSTHVGFDCVRIVRSRHTTDRLSFATPDLSNQFCTRRCVCRRVAGKCAGHRRGRCNSHRRCGNRFDPSAPSQGKTDQAKRNKMTERAAWAG
ncbi:MAG: hypothetical protein CMJ21_07125 [Phycisphaerae bacterium]|nr:hypothetical protein [Phycisphaerae bacterium]